MNAPSECRFLAWDSRFFGRDIARIERPTVEESALRRLLAEAREHGIDCVTWLVPLSQPRSLRAASACGLTLMDLRVTLARSLPPGARRADAPPGYAIGPCVAADVAALAAIARVSHRVSRFYSDPHFDDRRCGDLYETWIRKSCAGDADAVLVARAGDEACGYVTCHREDAGGRIGLFAIAETARGDGLGRALLDAALGWFVAQGDPRVQVVTQGRNLAAIRLYEACGFRTEAVAAWFHGWLTDGSAR